MTDKKSFADRSHDHATDDDSPHAHQAPDHRRWTDTVISTLTARWPTALALVQAAAAIAVIVLLGADVEFAPGPAVMAGIYMGAYALGRPASAWVAYPSLMAVVLGLIVLGVDAQVGMTVVLVLGNLRVPVTHSPLAWTQIFPR